MKLRTLGGTGIKVRPNGLPKEVPVAKTLEQAGANQLLMCGQIDLPVSKSTGSHHLKTLHHAGITAERQQGVCKYISLRRSELDERFPGLLDSVVNAADGAAAPRA